MPSSSNRSPACRDGGGVCCFGIVPPLHVRVFSFLMFFLLPLVSRLNVYDKVQELKFHRLASKTFQIHGDKFFLLV